MSTIAISLAIAAAVAVLATLALGLCRAARRPGDWLADVAWTTGPDYQARRARAEEEA